MSQTLLFVEDTLPMETGGKDDDFTEKNGREELPRRLQKLASNDGKKGGDGNNRKNEVTSLLFEQVNSNADELIELRGEGRYFGVTDPGSGTTINSLQSLGPLCANCHKRGHIRAKCKTVVCHKCGVVGDHYETQCPTTMVCARCGLKGHIAINCKNKVKKRQYCRHCDTFNHGDDQCPSIWRSYLTLSSADDSNNETKQSMWDSLLIWCYNCGSNSHFGDECTEARTSRVPNQNGSAFSGTNLPRELRAWYFDNLYKSKQSGNKRTFLDTQILANSNTSNDSRINWNNKNTNLQFYSTSNNSNNSNSSNNYKNYKNNNTRDYTPYLHNQNNSRSSYNNHNPPTGGPRAPGGQKPSRSGFLPNTYSSKNNQPTRSGFIGKKRKIANNGQLHQPTRSGLIQSTTNKAKSSKFRNIKNLY